MFERCKLIDTIQHISPSILFDIIKRKFGEQFSYKRDGMTRLLLRTNGMEKNPIWTIFVEDNFVFAFAVQPDRMTETEVTEFYTYLDTAIKKTRF